MIFRKTSLKSVLGRYVIFFPLLSMGGKYIICLTQNHLASLSICQVSLSGSFPSLGATATIGC